MSGVSSPTGATACSWRGSGRRVLGWWLRSRGRAGQARQAGRDGWALIGLAGAAGGRAHILHGGLHLLGISGPGSGLGSRVRHRHPLWGELSPWAALGLLIDLPCADLRRKRPPPLLFRIPLARVLFECLPRRVRVEILRSAKAQGVSAWRGSCAAVCGAAQGATRAGRGRAGGWACGRTSVAKSTSISSLCGTSAAPSCRRDGDRTSVMCGAGA